jgi:uncharacterized protein YdiU (UPF0061 family)
MNTDNMSIAGETIDYGPCAFVNGYSPNTVFSSIDQNSRYAFGNQPKMGEWNLTRFAESLLPLLAENREDALRIATDSLNVYQTKYRDYWLDAMRKKLGLINAEPSDLTLAEDLLMLMYKHQADFTNAFRQLNTPIQLEEGLVSDVSFQHWEKLWKERLSRQPLSSEQSDALMHANNPQVIPRNHLVEEVLEFAAQGNMAPVPAFIAVLQTPYSKPINEKYLSGAGAGFDENYQTFCGT